MAQDKKIDISEGEVKPPVDITSGYSDFPTQAVIEGSDPKAAQNWAADQLLEMAKGFGKQAGTIGWNASMANFGLDKPEILNPSNEAQKAGGTMASAASYFLPTGVEAKAAEKLHNWTRTLPGLAAYPLNVAGRAAIGGGSNALIAHLNEEDPAKAAMIGGALNALPAAIFGKGEYLRGSAIKSMMNALKPGTKQEKAAAQEVAGMLLDNFEMWARSKGIEKIADRHVREYLAEMDNFMADWTARMGGNEPRIPLGDIRQNRELYGQAEFMPGWSEAAGEARPLTDLQRDAYEQLTRHYYEYVSPLATGAPSGQTPFSNQSGLTPQVLNTATDNLTVPFSQAEAVKRSMQNTIADKGAFLGALKDPLSQARDLAYRVASTADKNTLERIAGGDYKAINESLHDWLTVRDIGKGVGLKEVGRVTPWAEEPFIGMGVPQFAPASPSTIIPGMLIRGARGAMKAPLWNTMAAQTKNQLVRPLTGGKLPGNKFMQAIQPTPEKVAALAAFLGSGKDTSGAVNIEEEGQPLNIGVQVSQPQDQPVIGEQPTNVFPTDYGSIAIPADVDSQVEVGDRVTDPETGYKYQKGPDGKYTRIQ